MVIAVVWMALSWRLAFTAQIAVIQRNFTTLVNASTCPTGKASYGSAVGKHVDSRTMVFNLIGQISFKTKDAEPFLFKPQKNPSTIFKNLIVGFLLHDQAPTRRNSQVMLKRMAAPTDSHLR